MRPEHQIKMLLKAALYKSDGSRTSFAKKYSITGYDDFEQFFKTMKENFKKDREAIAFDDIVELAKTVTGKFSAGIGEFGAFVFVLRTIGMILDDLRRLRKVINELKDEQKQEAIDLKEAEYLMEFNVITKVKDLITNVAKRLKLSYGDITKYVKNKGSVVFNNLSGKQAQEFIQKLKGKWNNVEGLAVKTATDARKKEALSVMQKIWGRAQGILETAKNNKGKIAIAAALIALASFISKTFFNQEIIVEEQVIEEE